MTNDAPSIRFLMIGGFLGAGKTTALARLARYYIERGQNVGLVTNDQAFDLVDTKSLQSQGFDVGEVPGACFCCRFNDLVDTMQQLADGHQPDVLITEPVGSCTDLVATVIEPLRHLYGDRFELGPLAVLIKPEHGLKILLDTHRRGFSPQAEYIFLKQIEEADVLALNKIDKLSAEQRQSVVEQLHQRFPGKRILQVSARHGDGFDEMIDALGESAPVHSQMMEVDYDTYAAGEAELGWLNCQVRIRADDGGARFSLDSFLMTLIGRLSGRLSAHGAETAHLKIMGQSGVNSAVANLVASDEPAELSVASRVEVANADITVNARVAMAPESLEPTVCEVVEKVAADFGLQAEIDGVQCFRPGRPEPTHRFAT